jgi:hypothetical protein
MGAGQMRSKIQSFSNSFLTCQKGVALRIQIPYNGNVGNWICLSCGQIFLIPDAMGGGRTIIDIRDWRRKEER